MKTGHIEARMDSSWYTNILVRLEWEFDGDKDPRPGGGDFKVTVEPPLEGYMLDSCVEYEARIRNQIQFNHSRRPQDVDRIYRYGLDVFRYTLYIIMG